MAWIESNQEVGRHPKTKKLARLLDISVVTAVGHLHYLWWWALDFAQDGLLSKYDESDISEACVWEGDAKFFVDMLVKSGYVDVTDDGLFIHDWFDYAGRIVTQREITKDKTRERVKKYREKVSKSCNADVTRYSNACNADVTPCNATTVPYPTVPYPTLPINNNNNNAREEFPAEKEPHEVTTMAIGTSAINWAEKNWGRMLSPGESGEIVAWCDEFSTRGSQESDAVVVEALKQCDYASVRNVKYLRAVLTDWREAGVLTVANVEARETERKSQKEHKRNKDPVGKTSPSKYEKFYL